MRFSLKQNVISHEVKKLHQFTTITTPWAVLKNSGEDREPPAKSGRSWQIF